MKKSLPSFEELVRMAQDEPETLERLREQMCEDIILSAPKGTQRKLRGLQFKIDMERRRTKTPMASCIRLSQMMHESFAQLREALNDMQNAPTQSLRKLVKDPSLKEELNTAKKNTQAEVIEFPAT